MNVSESIFVALFVMAVVFTVLGILWALIRVFSFIIINLQNRQPKKQLKSKQIP